jgi:RNA polymerase sigma factor (sigma-70 family)
MTADEILLHRYSTTGDPGAFRELADRYAGLVYSIGMRVTGDRHTAEDVCQDCFVELAQKSRLVRENVAGWLHALATSRSLNAIRSRQRRIRREQAVATDGEADAAPSESHELQALIDRALNGLSDDLRLPIIHHYLQGESQQQVAEHLGINQATVSRRLQRGVEQLRQRLHVFGVMTTTMAVVSLFAHGAAQAASVPVTGALTKIGLGGVGVTVAKSASGSLSAATMVLGAVFGNILAFLFLQGWIVTLLVVVELALLMRPPTWLRELLRAQAFGRDVVAHPMYPFRRWTWTIPPHDWKQRLVMYSCVAFTFAVIAIGKQDDAVIVTRPGWVVAFGLLAMLFLTLVVRLAWRVLQLRDRSADRTQEASEASSDWASWENIIGTAILALVTMIWLLSIPYEERLLWSKGTVLVWTWFVCCTSMTAWALIDRWRRSGRADGSSDAESAATDSTEMRPVARRYHLVLIGGLILLAAWSLIPAVVQSVILPERPPRQDPFVYRYAQDGTRIQVEVPEEFRVRSSTKGAPSLVIVAATAGLIFSLSLLRRVIRTRDQLPRSIWLLLVAISVLSASVGAGLTAYEAPTTIAASGQSDAATTLQPMERRPPDFQRSPTQLALIEKYATEAAVITVPDEQLPGNWFLARHDMPSEKIHPENIISLGLADVPELSAVTAQLVRIYQNPFATDVNGSACIVFAFCCENADAAQRLNRAWQNRGLCVDRLVIFIHNLRALRAPTTTDPAPVPTLLEHIEKTRSTLNPANPDPSAVPERTPPSRN